MRVQRISQLSELTTLAERWHELARGNPFRTPGWLVSWWEQYGTGRELCVLAVYDDADELRGLAPWYLEKTATGGRTLAFLGAGEVCSDYLGILCDTEDQGAVVSAIAEWLVQEQGITWDLLWLSGVAADEPTIAQLSTQLADAGLTIHARPGLNTWRIQFDGDWETYVESLSKSHRKQVRRFVRRMVDSGEATFRVARNEQELQQGLAILIDLHQRRRKSLGEPGCFADPRFASFIATAAERLHAQGMVRLGWIELDNRPISVEFQLAGGGITYAYQAGVNPDALDEEPGRIINIATLKLALDEGQQAFDFLRGDEPYKAHWRAEPRPSVELRIVANRGTARLRHGLWLAGDTLKRWFKAKVSTAEHVS